MKRSLIDRIPLDPEQSAGRVELDPGAESDVRSQALDWPGLMIEAGRNDIASVERVSLAHHYVGINAAPHPVMLYGVTDGGASRDIVIGPGEAWVTPAKQPVTLAVDRGNIYVRAAIDPRYLADETGTPLELRRAYGIQSPQLKYLMRALMAEADTRNPGGLPFVETLTRAVGQQVALHAGAEQPRPEVHRGGLSGGARRKVLELIDRHLDGQLSVERLAREVDLSPAHFAHAFKQTLGAPPHRYLMRMRLERARRMLSDPAVALSDVAQRAGFADQAHFTRLFKRHFGLTPGRMRRSG
jgi:AraC family transcriptional regulator